MPAVPGYAVGRSRAGEVRPMQPTQVIRIEAPHFTAALVLEDGIVVRFKTEKGKTTTTAPILRWMRFWKRIDVIRYCYRKGWKVDIFAKQ